jgi:hypothetical protein
LNVNLERAAVIHIPFGSGTAQFVWLDIDAGWEAAKLARAAHDYSKRKDLRLTDPLGDLLRAAETPGELRRLHQTHRDQWTDEHTVQAKRRIAALKTPAQVARVK